MVRNSLVLGLLAALALTGCAGNTPRDADRDASREAAAKPPEVVAAPSSVTPATPVADEPVPAVAPPTKRADTAVATPRPTALYSCEKPGPGGVNVRSLLPIVFPSAQVESLCRKHPEMGPCQYERSICRAAGGRVLTVSGEEITAKHEAEYDKRVMRVRFKAN